MSPAMSSRPLRRAFRLMYLTGPFPSRTRGSRMPLNSSCTWPLRHLQSHGSGRRFRAGAPRHHGPQRQAPGACQPLRVPHREGHREVLGDELKGRQHAPHRSHGSALAAGRWRDAQLRAGAASTAPKSPRFPETKADSRTHAALGAMPFDFSPPSKAKIEPVAYMGPIGYRQV